MSLVVTGFLKKNLNHLVFVRHAAPKVQDLFNQTALQRDTGNWSCLCVIRLASSLL